MDLIEHPDSPIQAPDEPATRSGLVVGRLTTTPLPSAKTLPSESRPSTTKTEGETRPKISCGDNAAPFSLGALLCAWAEIDRIIRPMRSNSLIELFNRTGEVLAISELVAAYERQKPSFEGTVKQSTRSRLFAALPV